MNLRSVAGTETGLHPVMFTKESAPAKVRNLTHLCCQCKDSNCEDGKTWTCIQAGLKCIEICVCENSPIFRLFHVRLRTRVQLRIL